MMNKMRVAIPGQNFSILSKSLSMRFVGRSFSGFRKFSPSMLVRLTLAGSRQPQIAYRRNFASIHPKSERVLQAQQLLQDGLKLLESGERDLAMDACQQSLRLHPTSAALYNIGNIYLQMGCTDDAMQNWKRSLELDPNHPDALVNMGNVEILVKKDPKKAIEYFTKAVQLAPNDGEIKFNLAVAYDRNQELELAISHYEDAIKSLSEHSGESSLAMVEKLQQMLNNARIRLAAKHTT